MFTTQYYNTLSKCYVVAMENKLKILNNSICIESNIYPTDKNFKKSVSKLKDMNPNNIRFLDFLIEKRLQDITLSRLNRYILTYFKYLDSYNLKEMNKESFINVYLTIKNRLHASSTKSMEWIIIKQITKYLEYDFDLSKYKIKVKNKLIKPNDLISVDEINTIFKSKISLEKKVMLSIMFDGAIRIGEAFSIKPKSFQKLDNIYLVRVEGKTGKRTIFVHRNIELIDKLLKSGWKDWSYGYDMMRKVLKRFEKRFNKRMHCHLTRHTRITDLYNKGVPLKSLQEFGGWKSTKMLLDVYSHVNNKEAIDNILRIEGIENTKVEEFMIN